MDKTEPKKKEKTNTIKLAQSHIGSVIALPFSDTERIQAFHKGDSIEVTDKELEAIGKHRWLIKEK